MILQLTVSVSLVFSYQTKESNSNKLKLYS